MDSARILVVDDEPNICTLVASTLRLVDFTTREEHSGSAALAAVAEFRPDVVLLDVMLPDLDGFEVARRLRRGGQDVAILFLTARDAVVDRVAGLSSGGDDYVTKPFSLEEIVWRIRAILRRTAAKPDQPAGAGLRFADLELSEETYEVRRGGTAVALSITEFKLLRFLMLNAGRVLSRAQILDRVWDYDFSGDGQIVDTYVYYLRKKLDPLGPRLIQTVRGAGYCMRLGQGPNGS
ncbi:response regulator transcription factor [Dactylosporangium sp. CA-092794]|uniref:response regulator transcription factor n=1 Tax=Dactylosporangium sp. CA-092794 TaxID=3239929 RepID=UPI003D8D1ACB